MVNKKNENQQHNDDVEIVASCDEEILDEVAVGEAVKKIKDKLKKCEKEKQEYLDGWQRVKADFINARKEEEKNRADFVKFAKEDILMQILPVVDSFEMAFSNKKAWEKVDDGWKKGVEYIYTQLLGVLKTNGFIEINPKGAVFDPHYHTSISHIPVKDKNSDGKVMEVAQKGYMLHGKIARVAQVTVGEYKNENKE